MEQLSKIRSTIRQMRREEIENKRIEHEKEIEAEKKRKKAEKDELRSQNRMKNKRIVIYRCFIDFVTIYPLFPLCTFQHPFRFFTFRCHRISSCLSTRPFCSTVFMFNISIIFLLIIVCYILLKLVNICYQYVL